MQSGTSYFNSTLYRKTMFRFCPLWALYGLILTFALPLNMLTRYFDRLGWDDSVAMAQRDLLDLATSLPQVLSLGVVLAAGFGVLCAMASFGYLYNNRSAYLMHMLPLRRESLFLTSYTAGLSMLLLPQLAAALLGALVELTLLPSSSWGPALSALGIWFLAQSAFMVFFFSFAVFCAMFTGHLLALPAFYAILNVLVLALYTLVTALMDQFFYGFHTRGTSSNLVLYATPANALIQAAQWDVGQTTIAGVTTTTGQWHLASPVTIGCYAAVGLAFAVAALLIYRSRHVESAGDVVAISLVRPVFRCGVSLCSGLCLGLFTAMFFSWNSNTLPLTACVLLWAVIGWFVAEMLLKKSFAVLSAWKGCVAMVSAISILSLCCYFDVFGVVNRVPQVSQVASVSVSGDFGYPDDAGMNRLNDITDPQQIAQLVALHQAIVDNRERSNMDSPHYENGDDYIFATFEYQLTTGAALDRRYYSVPVFKAETQTPGSVTQAITALNQNRELIEASYNFDHYEQGRLVGGRLEGAYFPQQNILSTYYLDSVSRDQLSQLWAAVGADFDQGTLGVRYLFHDDQRLSNTYRTDLYFEFEMPSRQETQLYYYDSSQTYLSTLSITLTPHASNTLAWLKEFGGLGQDYQLATHQQSETIEWGEMSATYAQ